ncbi:MAG: amidophosphoribosyltransferase [Planctomycetes bacterium]|nr:amidophosphoribosyltransferase [Planctomycetota bacterium]
MCGIAGIVYRHTGPLGSHLLAMLGGLQHRGPDSTGVAVYPFRNGDGLVARVRCDAAAASRVTAALKAQGITIQTADFKAGNLRLVLEGGGAVRDICRAIDAQPGAEVTSLGTRLEILKEVGSAGDLEHAHGISSVTGTHGIGHVRLATESDVDACRAHPFWAYGYGDVATVHNGQITNYYKLKRRLQARGCHFRTDNDSELIGTYLAYHLSLGESLHSALERAVRELDGTFSFLVSTADGIGFAKDRLAAKPLMYIEREDLIAVATEEIALQCLFPHESLRIVEPMPGTLKTWLVNELASAPAPASSFT